MMCTSTEDLMRRAQWNGALGGSRNDLLVELQRESGRTQTRVHCCAAVATPGFQAYLIYPLMCVSRHDTSISDDPITAT